MATVKLTPVAADEAEQLPNVIHDRIMKIIKRLENWPAVSGVKGLSGNLSGWYRVRTGDYRIRFRVEGDTLIVDKIGHRKDVYED
jgi:mRNA interferase RelE/StbE